MDDYYDSIADGYDSLHREEQEKKLNLISPLIEIRKDDLLIDVGCGTGISSQRFKCRKIGIDPSIGLLKKVIDTYPINSKGEYLPFKSDIADIVISLTAIQNFDDMSKGVDEMIRISKDTLVISILKKSAKCNEFQKKIKSLFNQYQMLEEDKDFIYIMHKVNLR